MPYYGNVITEKEWLDRHIEKWCIEKLREVNNYSECDPEYRTYFEMKICKETEVWNLLAFHTKEQAEEFLKNNRILCKQFYMM